MPTLLEEAIQACRFAIEYDNAVRECGNDPAKMDSFCTASGEPLDCLYQKWQTQARRVLDLCEDGSRACPERRGWMDVSTEKVEQASRIGHADARDYIYHGTMPRERREALIALLRDYDFHVEACAAHQRHIDELELYRAEHERLKAELNTIIHPDGNGPTKPSFCDLVTYVKMELKKKEDEG